MRKEELKQHYHTWNLPRSVFPRGKTNKSKHYVLDLNLLHTSLSFTNRKLQESAQIASFHIKSISAKKGYQTSPKEVFPTIEDFVYHYENFCYRVYVLREKLLQFINEILPVSFPDGQVRISQMVINPVVKNSKLLSEIEKFNKKKSLGKIIADRKLLTHKLYYANTDRYLRPKIVNPGDVWVKEWLKEVVSRANMANVAMEELSKINHGVSKKIIEYRLKTHR